MTQAEYQASHRASVRAMDRAQRAVDRDHRRAVWQFRFKVWRHRWAIQHLRWWLPGFERQKLASGAFEGWHLWWGAIHAWDVTDHNRRRHKGWGWR